jgi:hypothetical protein
MPADARWREVRNRNGVGGRRKPGAVGVASSARISLALQFRSDSINRVVGFLPHPDDMCPRRSLPHLRGLFHARVGPTANYGGRTVRRTEWSRCLPLLTRRRGRNRTDERLAEVGHSYLVMKLNVDLPTAKRISRFENLERCRVDLVISNLSYGQYTWGFYRSDILAASLYNCERISRLAHIGVAGNDPRAPSFVLGKVRLEGAQARIEALALRDEDGRTMYSFSSSGDADALTAVRK